MEFKWDDEKADKNLKKHGVSFEEAKTVFNTDFAEFLPDLTHSIGEARFTCSGPSSAGRLLLVAFTERGKIIRIITARKMTPREKKSYEKEIARRQQS